MKTGDIVKIVPEWREPHEDPDQLYVVVEVVEYDDHTKIDITPLNTGLHFPPINTVRPESLEPTGERIGQ